MQRSYIKGLSNLILGLKMWREVGIVPRGLCGCYIQRGKGVNVKVSLSLVIIMMVGFSVAGNRLFHYG